MPKFPAALFLVFASVLCSAQDHAPYTLYLIGDGGEPSFTNVAYKKLIQSQLQGNESHQAIVFLGDNIYPKGMPEIGAPLRSRAESILQNQINMVGGGSSPIYILPGNHDWKRGKREGWEFIRNQQQWIDSLKNENINFFPKAGCPGPVEIPLTNELVLVILDTQWLLHPWDKPEGSESPCDTKSVGDVFTQLDDILRRNQGKRVVITAHHPVFTYGEHGGIYNLREHIFPLTDFKKNLWIPLPIIGSIYPFYRKFVGNIQDVSNPQYKQFTSALKQLLHNYPGTIYAAGHEHTLQYSDYDSIHYIVSGAGSKSTPVRKKGHAQFAASAIGYARLQISGSGDAAIEYFSGDEMLYRKTLTPPRAPDTDNTDAEVLIGAKSATAAASHRYTVSRTHERWLGKNYRDIWGAEIPMPVFDIGSEQGGLKIIQRGGGQQTLSLRLKDSVGREWTLRSIEKYPAKAIPEAFRNTFAEGLVQDQISAAHPYGAVVVPALAKAAGIFHTNPKVVLIPDDKRFGIYRKDVRGQVMLFEERPAGTGEGQEYFGGAKKIISVDKLMDKLQKDNDNHVDQKFVLRNRLFDMLIGDWDRHDDQWRWAEFEEKKGNVYRPIPRDRDQAFFVNEGIIPPVWKRKWLLPKFEGFKDSIRWAPGLMFNGRYFDRTFLTELSREQWIVIAKDLAARMTDEAIDSAVHLWPEPIVKLHGDEIARKLKSRRARLEQHALDHYLFLAREVTVVGSDKREVFEVTHNENGNVLVEMFKSGSDGKGKKIYSREFVAAETKEVRIYGRGGDDQFNVVGKQRKHHSIAVRIVGGEGQDVVVGSGKLRKDFIYDVPGGIVVEGDGNIKDRTSSDPTVNVWDRLEFQYNKTIPLVYANSNVDDGLFLGGGALIVTQGFRKPLFKNRHFILGSYAFNTSSFNLRYDGRFTQLFGKWNLELDADAKSPNYVNNFFGLGNESLFNQHINESVNVDHSIQFYRMRLREYDLEAKVSRRIGQVGFFKIGGAFQHASIEDPGSKPRYIGYYDAVTPEKIIEAGKTFGGLVYSWGFDKRNSLIMPTRGIYFQQTSRWMAGLANSAPNFSSHNIALNFYQSFRLPARVTFAFRVSGGKNFGTYQLYQAQILDGRTEIRGFRKTRFYGDSKLVFNNEIRIKLASFHSYLFPASIGITGFYDAGRVWYKDANGIDPTAPSGKSHLWHSGVGGGIWFTPFALTVITVEVAHSQEENLGYFRMGFLF